MYGWGSWEPIKGGDGIFLGGKPMYGWGSWEPIKVGDWIFLGGKPMYGWGSWEPIKVGDGIFLGVYHSIVLSYIDLFLNSVTWNSNSFLNSVIWKLHWSYSWSLCFLFFFYVYHLKTSERQWYFVLDLELFMYLIQIEK